MVNIHYRFDKEKDLKIWLEFVRDPIVNGRDTSKYLSKEEQEILKMPKNKQKEFIRKHIDQYYTKEYKDSFLIDTKQKINKPKEEIIKRLEKIHDKKIPVNDIVVYYNTYNICPYFYNKTKKASGFYVSRFVMDINHEINVFIHETMHVFFHCYFWSYCVKKGLNKEQINDIKEAVSVIINHEFKDIISNEDIGYPNHKKLRKIIEKEWIKEKNFIKMLDKIIENKIIKGENK